jgi:hypothetical protein
VSSSPSIPAGGKTSADLICLNNHSVSLRNEAEAALQARLMLQRQSGVFSRVVPFAGCLYK